MEDMVPKLFNNISLALLHNEDMVYLVENTYYFIKWFQKIDNEAFKDKVLGLV